MPKTWKVAGINFDHGHMGMLLDLVQKHPRAEICGVADPKPGRIGADVRRLGLGQGQVFEDEAACVDKSKPDFLILCPATQTHGEWVEKVARFKLPVMVEKPFAASLAEADTMIQSMKKAGQPLAINWPLAWYPPHVTAKRLIDEGRLGEVQEIHYYDGNRGPVRPDIEMSSQDLAKEYSKSWFYQKSQGGGSLLDYLGYGVTLASWFLKGERPLEVSSMSHGRPGLEVDEQSVTTVRYEKGLSVFQTRWGTFSDPWEQQPQPKCGFVIKGSQGTLSNYDYETKVRLQSPEHPGGEDVPVDKAQAPYQDPIQYFIHCLEKGEEIQGPLSVEISRLGQEIVDAAQESIQKKRPVAF